MKKILILSLLLVVMFCLNGCIERRLYVKTDPPGATFYFNDEAKGQTPLSFDFQWYWTHKVRLEKEGYKPIESREVIKAPPYMWIPLDLMIELLPFKIKDHRYLEYKLNVALEKEKAVSEE